MRKVTLLLCVLFLFGCVDVTVKDAQVPSADMSGYEVGEQHQFTESSMGELLQDAQRKENKVYYIGYIDCPWCQSAVPVLDDAAREAGLVVDYIALYDRGHNLLISEEEREAFFSFAQDHLDKDEEGEAVLYVPYVFVLKEGKIVNSHIGTLSEHDATIRDLSDEEKDELKRRYLEMMREL